MKPDILDGQFSDISQQIARLPVLSDSGKKWFTGDIQETILEVNKLTSPYYVLFFPH